MIHVLRCHLVKMEGISRHAEPGPGGLIEQAVGLQPVVALELGDRAPGAGSIFSIDGATGKMPAFQADLPGGNIEASFGWWSDDRNGSGHGGGNF